MSSTRIRNANILLVTLKALGNEIAKNLVLAGIGTLTVVDDGVVREEDLGGQFLVTEENLNQSVCSHLLTDLTAEPPVTNAVCHRESRQPHHKSAN